MDELDELTLRTQLYNDFFPGTHPIDELLQNEPRPEGIMNVMEEFLNSNIFQQAHKLNLRNDSNNTNPSFLRMTPNNQRSPIVLHKLQDFQLNFNDHHLAYNEVAILINGDN